MLPYHIVVLSRYGKNYGVDSLALSSPPFADWLWLCSRLESTVSKAMNDPGRVEHRQYRFMGDSSDSKSTVQYSTVPTSTKPAQRFNGLTSNILGLYSLVMAYRV